MVGDDDFLDSIAQKLTPEEMDKLRSMLAAKQAADEDPKEDDEEKRDPPGVTKAAMDAAIASAVRLASAKAEKATVSRLRAIRDAEEAVRPHIGSLAIAQDSAAAVYRLAFDHLQVDYAGVPEEAYPAMLKLVSRADQDRKPRLAADSAPDKGYTDRYPGLSRFTVV